MPGSTAQKFVSAVFEDVFRLGNDLPQDIRGGFDRADKSRCRAGADWGGGGVSGGCRRGDVFPQFVLAVHHLCFTAVPGVGESVTDNAVADCVEGKWGV